MGDTAEAGIGTPTRVQRHAESWLLRGGNSVEAKAICVERDAESDAYLHEKVVVEQFKLLQPLFSTDLKQALISELVGSLVEG